jgi:hypothetical protein
MALAINNNYGASPRPMDSTLQQPNIVQKPMPNPMANQIGRPHSLPCSQGTDLELDQSNGMPCRSTSTRSGQKNITPVVLQDLVEMWNEKKLGQRDKNGKRRLPRCCRPLIGNLL